MPARKEILLDTEIGSYTFLRLELSVSNQRVSKRVKARQLKSSTHIETQIGIRMEAIKNPQLGAKSTRNPVVAFTSLNGPRFVSTTTAGVDRLIEKLLRRLLREPIAVSL